MADKLKILSETVNEVTTPNISTEETQVLYHKWAETGTYDTLHDDQNYTGPKRIHDTMVQLFPDPASRESIKVLDLGAGTGLIGERLSGCGFKHLDALEPLKKFVEVASGKNIYEKIYESFIGGGAVVDTPDASYDVVVASGAYAPGHIPVDSFYEIIRVLKPGGYFVNSMRHSYLWVSDFYKNKFEPLCKQLEEEGKWRIVTWEIYPNHFMSHDGLLMVTQV